MINSDSSPLAITAITAIILFIIKECIEGWRRWKRSRQEKILLTRMLSFEIELNYWSFSQLFNLIEKLSSYKSMDDFEYSIRYGIETYYSVQLTENGIQYSQALLPFYRKNFELLFPYIGTLSHETFNNIQNLYITINELDSLRIIIINLLSENLYIDHPDHTLDSMKSAWDSREEHYESLNAAYFSMTGKRLLNHRLE